MTTGPWELRPDDPKLPLGHGHFVSVWQRQGDGEWRVSVDIGISHAKPARGVGMDEVTPGPVHAARPPAGALPDLMALDLAWSEDARARGSAAAFARRAARDVRFYRDGLAPVVGAAGGREMMRLVPGVTRWDPEAQRVVALGRPGVHLRDARAPRGGRLGPRLERLPARLAPGGRRLEGRARPRDPAAEAPGEVAPTRSGPSRSRAAGSGPGVTRGARAR